MEDRLGSVEFTPDGKIYVYSFTQSLSELHLVDGLKSRVVNAAAELRNRALAADAEPGS